MVTFQLPSGPKQLAEIFEADDAVNFDNIEEYYLQLVDGEDIILTTPRYKKACCCSDNTVRLFFTNYLGGIDSIKFRIMEESTETQSDSWKKPLRWPLQKFDGGKQRFNVVSNETLTVENNCYEESEQEYLKEVMGSANAWLQWTGTQGQSDDYIPVVVKDGKFITRKSEGRYEYILQLELEYSNENQTLRN